MKRLFASLLLICVLFSPAIHAAAAYESKTYLYGGSTATYLNRVDKTGANITSACPDYFEVAADGSLKYTRPVDPLLLSSLKAKGITATPFLSNHWDRGSARAMLAKRAPAALQLADAVKKYGLDGLDIDIQNITHDDKSNFTDFIRLLRNALPAGKILTVCVPANPYYTTIGWQGGYDYKALAGYCDHVFMMTYDESYSGGEPGPVASLWFIETSIKYGLQYVPPKKLMIGIPFYGRYWSGATKGAAFTTADIEWLVANQPSAVWYDANKECARAAVSIPAGTEVTTWGGKKVAGGVYDIWYENDRSFEKKLSLVRKYGILGVGSWALGQEPAEIWNKYSVWLYGDVFKDISSHWSQSYIVELNLRGILNGRGGGLFDPGGLMTRAEAAAMFVRLAGIKPGALGGAFTDTANHWSRDYVSAARAAGLVSGITDKLFEPDRPVTREEFAVIAERYTNIEDTFDMTQQFYRDVSPEGNPWSNKAIVKLSINGVIAGFPDGNFYPKKPITRAEAAKVAALVSALPSRFVAGTAIPQNEAKMGPR